jgi:hypothetical protein
MLPALADFRPPAQQFIQGDMPANVFKTARQFARRPDPGGRVGTAGEPADRLKVVKMRQGLVEIG